MFDYLGYVESKLSKIEVNSTGQIIADCPFCDKPKKFYADKKSGNYICFSCNERGRGLVGFVAKMEGISHQEAKRFISDDESSLVRELTLGELLQKLRPVEVEPEALKVDIPLPAGFVSLFDGKKWRYPAYLKERGIPRELAHKYRLGFAESGKYSGRVIIPIECPNGRSFTARAIGASKRKYLNPKSAGFASLLFGWEQCAFDGHVVLVEGAFDAIQMSVHGFQPLALLGKVLHHEQQNLFWGLPSDLRVTIMLDADALVAAHKVAAILSERFDHVSIAQLPDGMDPGDADYDQALQAIMGAERYSRLGGTKGRLRAMLG